MDVLFFLNKRINFIRQFHAVASAPFIDRKRMIEAGEEPFAPSGCEEEEPAFLEEWVEADESLQVLAYSCVSMLAAALHLYLESWVTQSGLAVEESMKKSVFQKHGWFSGYKAHFEKHFKITFENGPANLQILVEVTIARNRIEHPSSITTRRTQYQDSDLQKLRHPFFVDELESSLFSNVNEEEKSWVIPPTVQITGAQLLAAVSEVERFSAWFESEIVTRVYGR